MDAPIFRGKMSFYMLAAFCVLSMGTHTTQIYEDYIMLEIHFKISQLLSHIISTQSVLT